MVEKKAALEKLPGFSQGVRRNAAARMITMAQPICPNSKIDMIRTPEGKAIPNPNPDPHKRSCQEERDEDGNSVIGWWNKCEALGHDPYFSKRVWYSKEDIYEIEEATGQQVKTGERTVRHETKYPNVTQVAAHKRVNSGRGPVIKMNASGFKRLKDIGYEEVCEYRGCQKPVAVGATVGFFCSREHAQLVAADEFAIIDYQIPQTGTLADQPDIENGQRRKERQFLAEASEVAEVRNLR